MVTKVLFLTFMSMCMGIGICMGTEPPSEPFQGTFETHIKGWCEPVRLILHGRKYYEENKAPSWDDSFERTQCLPSWRQEN